MNTDKLIFRTVFVDRDVDAEVLSVAKRLHAKPGSVFRLILETGLAQLGLGAALQEASADATVMRATYLPIASDEHLSGLACHLRIDKSELIRRVTKVGLLTVQASLKD